MTSRRLVLGLVLLLVGCNGEGDIEPTDPGRPGEVQLVDGQAVCDSCASVRIGLSGPGIVNVTEATLVASDPARTPVLARIVLARQSGASGDVLFVNAYFDEGISEGVFDLWLDPVSDRAGARVVPGALRVTRPRPGPGEMAVLRVLVRSTGVDRDGRFLLRTEAGCQGATCPPVAVAADTAITLQLPPGAYTFQLDDVASNCTLGGAPNPYPVTLERGKATALSYWLSCTLSTTPGWVRVANVTTGADLPDKYPLVCSAYTCPPFSLAANRDTVLRVLPGELAIRITEVAPNCTLAGAQTVSVRAAAGDTVDVGFAVACRALPAVRVTISATGRDIDPAFTVLVCPMSGPCFYQSTFSRDVITFPSLAPGEYFVQLYDLAENCTYNGPSSYTVTVLGNTVNVAFAVTCRAFSTVRVSTVTSGTSQDASYEVVRSSGCDDYYVPCDRKPIASSGSIDFRTASGPQTFLLTDVASNCTVTAANPATVTAIEDAIVDLRFEVVCQ